MLQDEFAVAGVVAIELKAGLVRDQGLKQRLALDERQAETSQPSRCKRSKA